MYIYLSIDINSIVIYISKVISAVNSLNAMDIQVNDDRSEHSGESGEESDRNDEWEKKKSKALNLLCIIALHSLHHLPSGQTDVELKIKLPQCMNRLYNCQQLHHDDDHDNITTRGSEWDYWVGLGMNNVSYGCLYLGLHGQLTREQVPYSRSI